MIRHLTLRDYRTMAWANGRGITTELARLDAADGAMQWRLSMAQVVEDGSFSIFPGIDRNLTVISGPGFALRGSGLDLFAGPYRPVAFPGDVPVAGFGVTSPSVDFNVMWARASWSAEVAVLHSGAARLTGDACAAFAPEGAVLSLDGAQRSLDASDLLLARGALAFGHSGGAPVLTVCLRRR
ncbi:MAG: HutD family protein [Gemmobacter sp.]